nr:uncharacterized protein LOC105345712 isoform X2 [Crassostrea gigas]
MRATLGRYFITRSPRNQPCAWFDRSDCIPSQHIKDDPHKIWICVEKETGTIRSSYCTCTAGLGSPCVHVVSVLFRIETAHRLGVSACTSLPCSWTVPAFKSTRAPPSKLKELEVSKPVHSLTCGKKRSLVSTIKKEFNPVHTGNTTKDCLKDITDAIRNSIPNACVFKGTIISKWYRYTKRRSENQNRRARQHTEVYARENGHGWTRRPKYSSQSEAGNC